MQTSLDYERESNWMYLLSEVSLALGCERPAGVYRLLYVSPHSYGDEMDLAPPPSLDRAWHVMYGLLPSETPFTPFLSAATRPPAGPIPAVQMVDDVRDWLGLTYDDVADISGVSRGALFYWRTHPTSPRPGNVRRIARLHALAELLIRRFGVSGARSWLAAGSPSPFERLRSQDIAGVEDQVRQTLFAQPDLRPSELHAVGDPVDFELVGERAPAARARRRPKRGRSSQP